MSGADPIPAIREEDATGEIAALFADLRTALGVPFVNLIWRHLATIPGGLAWTWGVVGPLYGTAALSAAAAELRGLVALPDLATIPDHAFDAAGVDAEARAAIRNLIADYNTANAANFLAMLVALAVLRDEARAAGETRGETVGRTADGAVGSVPAIPLPALADLSPPVLALVRDLDGFGRLGESAAIASLYRHLAHWPPYLALARTALSPLHRSGALAAEQERVIAAGRRHAAALAPRAAARPPLDASSADRVVEALDGFTRLMIGRMIVMGTALHGLLEAEGPAR
ncbi:hypothetical protein Q8W71_15225 [Methylobacterium sp. NEAU 140]|uniref:hypothetical protein n=1 Tax=Methylobacterium sp. NEAU 140 TaxID=3064945 RepID=UPI002734EBCA|nr:hypothetical protein [Methylobacterium sp. NEAU 140]MDP4023981.1 hypothetical protein [Methylobacterium sp. NEAU 140]